MMRCFLPCFCGKSKRTKHLSSASATPKREKGQTHVAGAVEPAIQLTRQKPAEEHIDCITQSKEEQEKAAREEETPHIDKKKDEYEEDDEITKRLLQEESSESLFSLSIGSRKQVSGETEVNSPMKHPGVVCTRKDESEAFESEKVQHVSSVQNPLENLVQGKPSKADGVESSKKEAKENSTRQLIVKPEEQPNCIAIRNVNPNKESTAKELIKQLEENKEEKGNHPRHRYQDCCDESDLEVTFERKENGEDVNGTWVQEESSESLFSLSIDSRKRVSSSAEKAENEVNSVMPAHITEEESEGRIVDVSSVLNPIENVTQGRVVKATMCSRMSVKDKENINLEVQHDVDIPISPEPNLKLSKHKTRQKKFSDKEQEIGVDTSLSSWLVEPEPSPISISSANSVGEHNTPKLRRGSPMSHEDRPILGALSIEEIRKYSVSAVSSRTSRSRSPDETPIIGTVGSYWSHTGQSMDSELNKNGKDAKWSSTTFNSRLEKAFEAEVLARVQ